MGAKGNSFDDIRSQAEAVLRVWTENSDLALSGLTKTQFQTLVDSFNTKRANVDGLRSQLTAGVNEVNDLAKQLVSINTRARSAARGQYGPNSTQYEQLGGTRVSDRKPRRPKSKP